MNARVVKHYTTVRERRSLANYMDKTLRGSRMNDTPSNWPSARLRKTRKCVRSSAKSLVIPRRAFGRASISRRAFTFLGGGGGGGLGRLLRKSVSTWSGSDVGFTPESADCRYARFVNYIVWIMSFVKFLTPISAVDGEAHGRKSAGAHARSHQLQ
jgi:hypothetical protein